MLNSQLLIWCYDKHNLIILCINFLRKTINKMPMNISLMFTRPGPNSPIDWVRDCVQRLVPVQADKEKQALHRSKLLVGFNFYGLHFHSQGGGHALGRE